MTDPSPDDAPADEITAIHDQLAALQDLFRRRLLEDRDKRRALDVLEEQLAHARQALNGQALLPLARELLLAVDRVGSHADREADLLADEVVEALHRRGLEPIDTDGAFDPAGHEAVATRPATAERPAGTIAGVQRLGYRLGEHLVRPARVVVHVDEASGPDAASTPRAEPTVPAGSPEARPAEADLVDIPWPTPTPRSRPPRP